MMIAKRETDQYIVFNRCFFPVGFGPAKRTTDTLGRVRGALGFGADSSTPSQSFGRQGNHQKQNPLEMRIGDQYFISRFDFLCRWGGQNFAHDFSFGISVKFHGELSF